MLFETHPQLSFLIVSPKWIFHLPRTPKTLQHRPTTSDHLIPRTSVPLLIKLLMIYAWQLRSIYTHSSVRTDHGSISILSSPVSLGSSESLSAQLWAAAIIRLVGGRGENLFLVLPLLLTYATRN